MQQRVNKANSIVAKVMTIINCLETRLINGQPGFRANKKMGCFTFSTNMDNFHSCSLDGYSPWKTNILLAVANRIAFSSFFSS